MERKALVPLLGKSTFEELEERLLLEGGQSERWRGPSPSQTPLIEMNYIVQFQKKVLTLIIYILIIMVITLLLTITLIMNIQIPLSVEMPSRVSVLPLLTGQRSGDEGGLWEEILCALSRISNDR